MLIHALHIYCKKTGIKLSTPDNVNSLDELSNINNYIHDDYFYYKPHTFVCNDCASLPDVFIVEYKANDFIVCERVMDKFCCLSGEIHAEENIFLQKKIIALTPYPKSFDALEVFRTIKKKTPKSGLLLIPMVTFSLLLPFYSNLFNSRLVYSTSLASVLYISVFFVFFAGVEMFLKTTIYKYVSAVNKSNSVALNKFIVYILSIASDKMAPSTGRAIETSASIYWKSISLVGVDLSLFLCFFLCLILLLGQYTILLFVYYLFFSFFCIYARFKSYENSIKSIRLGSDKIIDSIALHSNRAQTLFSNFKMLQHVFLGKAMESERLNYILTTHAHHWSEALKLNSFISMIVMYISCYLAVNGGHLSIATIIAVMIVNSRVSTSLIASVNGIYNIKLNLHQMKLSLLKLLENIERRGDDKVHINYIEQVLFENITIEPHGRSTLTSYSAQFNTGDVIIISGEVGSGKSTLLRSVIAQSKVQQGVIRYNQVNNMHVSNETFQKSIAYYDTSFRFFKGTLRFNFNLYGIYAGERIIEIINDCCRGLIVDHLILDEMDAESLNISSGERQKLIISMILEKKPSLIVLDEPTAFMSGNDGLDFMKKLISCHIDSIFFIATHEPLLKQVATRSIHINNENKHKKIFINTPIINRPG